MSTLPVGSAAATERLPATTTITRDTGANPSVSQALQRLQASRRRLQDQWLPEPAPGRGRRGTGSLRQGGLAGLWRHWRRKLARVPAAQAVGDLLSGWWQNHPWRGTAELVSHDVVPQLGLAVRRHPLLAVTLAAGAGVALVVCKPWRSTWCRSQWQTLPTRLGHAAWQLAAQAPLHGLLAGLLGAATGAATGAAAASAAQAGATGTATETPSPENPHA